VSTFLLINPSSRSGATARRVPEIETLMRRYVGEYQVLRTECAGDGERLACLAAERGATRLVIAGGDGTVSEAVSGLLRCGRANAVDIALLPLGTGHDFARLLGLGVDLETTITRLSTGQRRRVDAGRIRCRSVDGSERVRCFLNIASIGLSVESVRWLAARGSEGRRGPLSYVMSGLVGIARYTTAAVIVRVDERIVHEGPLSLAAVGNGQYFGGGMRVAPGASIDDGLFDVVVIEGLSSVASLLMLPRLLFGRHIGDPRVRVHRGAVIRAESAVEMWIEADGELVGMLPGTIEVLPGAVRLCGLP
jgi:diacylglycerol kinase (ATP)